MRSHFAEHRITLLAWTESTISKFALVSLRWHLLYCPVNLSETNLNPYLFLSLFKHLKGLVIFPKKYSDNNNRSL